MTSMEENLKISEVEYCSDHWSDLSNILNLSLFDGRQHLKCIGNPRVNLECGSAQIKPDM